MNFFPGTIRVNGSAAFEGPGGVRLPLKVPSGRLAAWSGARAVYGVRPEHFTLADDGIEAEIQVVEPTGSETQVVARMGGQEMLAVFRERHQFSPGDRVRLKPDARLVHMFDQTSGRRLS
jgi:multiple sugar transport system ATP-binding protein